MRWTAEDSLEVPKCAEDDGLRVGDDVSANRCSPDDQEFERLEQHQWVPVRQITAEYRPYDYQ